MNILQIISELHTDTLAQIVADLRNSPSYNKESRELETACEKMLKYEIQNELVIESMIDEERNR